MLFFSDNILIVFLTISIIISIIIWLKLSYKNLEQSENNKLKLLSLEIQKEKQVSKKLNNIPLEIEKIEKQTHKKLLQINVDIMNIDFNIDGLLK